MMNHMPMQQQPHHPQTAQAHFYQVINRFFYFHIRFKTMQWEKRKTMEEAFGLTKMFHIFLSSIALESDRSWCTTNATDVLCCCFATISRPCSNATTTAFHRRTAASVFEYHCSAISNWILPTASISSTNFSERSCRAVTSAPKWLQSANVGWTASKTHFLFIFLFLAESFQSIFRMESFI